MSKSNLLMHLFNAHLPAGCKIGPDVCIGAGAKIADGVRLSNCVVMSGVKVGSHSKVDSCIVGWDSCLGCWCRLENFCILGKDVTAKVGWHARAADKHDAGM